jgi:Uncharacterised nucleotidyltransferase
VSRSLTPFAPAARQENVGLWQAVDRLIDRVGDVYLLRAHKLQLLAAARWRETGRMVPPDVLEEERLASLRLVLAAETVARVRKALGEPIILFKGPEIAALYPTRRLRPFEDVDILVHDVEAAHNALLEVGFVERNDPVWAFRRAGEDLFADLHHSRPLELPGLPLRLELHRRPSWPKWLPAPPVEELWDRAVPSVSGGDGVLALAPADHALVVAAHAWVGIPVERVRDLVDVLAIADGAREHVSAQAHAWSLDRLWRHTVLLCEAVLFGGSPTATQRLWARGLVNGRDRSVAEVYLARMLGPFSALPFGRAVLFALSRLPRTLRPAVNETWRQKVRRIRLAVTHARSPKGRHDRTLGPQSRQFRL